MVKFPEKQDDINNKFTRLSERWLLLLIILLDFSKN